VYISYCSYCWFLCKLVGLMVTCCRLNWRNWGEQKLMSRMFKTHFFSPFLLTFNFCENFWPRPWNRKQSFAFLITDLDVGVSAVVQWIILLFSNFEPISTLINMFPGVGLQSLECFLIENTGMRELSHSNECSFLQDSRWRNVEVSGWGWCFDLLPLL